MVIEYRDPWCFNPYTHKNKRLIDKKIDYLIERNIIKSADLIITVSSKLNSFLKKYFPIIRKKPIYSIPNGLNLDIKSNYVKKDISEIVLIYTGTLSSKRTIIPLLKIISDLKKENLFKNFKFALKIFGAYDKQILKKAIKMLDVENLIFLGGFINRSKAFKEISESDLAIHIGEKFHYPTIAFKVWDYLSCRKKILYLGREDSYTARFLKKNGLNPDIT